METKIIMIDGEEWAPYIACPVCGENLFHEYYYGHHNEATREFDCLNPACSAVVYVEEKILFRTEVSGRKGDK